MINNVAAVRPISKREKTTFQLMLIRAHWIASVCHVWASLVITEARAFTFRHLLLTCYVLGLAIVMPHSTPQSVLVKGIHRSEFEWLSCCLRVSAKLTTGFSCLYTFLLTFWRHDPVYFYTVQSHQILAELFLHSYNILHHMPGREDLTRNMERESCKSNAPYLYRFTVPHMLVLMDIH